MALVKTSICTWFYIDIASFLNNTDTKIYLTDQESNNVGVSFNKHLKNWRNSLGQAHDKQRIRSDHFWVKIITQ